MKNRNFDNQSKKNRTEEKMYPVRVWDTPTRLFHWLLVGLVIFSLITGKIGISAMQYHEWSGFAILVLVGFRLVWGFIGGQQTRFSTFIKGPATVIRYASSLLREDSKRHLGHNPLGGWSIIAMLASLLIQIGTGLFANDDILTEGPLYALVSKETSDWLTGVHHLNLKVLMILVAIHICAVMFYLIAKRENLISPMITGSKLWHQPLDSARGNPALALLLVAVMAAVAYVAIY
jgi:cytochrome b